MVVTPTQLLERMGEPLALTAYDWDAAGAAPPLPPEARFQLVYAAQVEWGTEGTFASLDVSNDPIVGRFLDIWLAQEMAHAALLVRYLRTHGESVHPLHRTRTQRFAAQRGRWINQAAVRILGADFFAVHMTWGAVNELTTLRFYSLLRRRSADPVLQTLLSDVIAQEAVHFAFYFQMAAELLHDNRRAQRITRWVLSRCWSPVGVGLRSRQDADRLMHGLFATEPAEIRGIDARVGRLPGLRDLDLMSHLLSSSRVAAAPPRADRRRGLSG
jgi:hypothetical protein